MGIYEKAQKLVEQMYRNGEIKARFLKANPDMAVLAEAKNSGNPETVTLYGIEYIKVQDAKGDRYIRKDGKEDWR